MNPTGESKQVYTPENMPSVLGLFEVIDKDQYQLAFQLLKPAQPSEVIKHLVNQEIMGDISVQMIKIPSYSVTPAHLHTQENKMYVWILGRAEIWIWGKNGWESQYIDSYAVSVFGGKTIMHPTVTVPANHPHILMTGEEELKAMVIKIKTGQSDSQTIWEKETTKTAPGQYL